MKKSVAIIGGGPSALMLAAELDEKKFNVTIYEKNAAVGRKFLVAGDGGFNLTHSEETQQFINRYTPTAFFEPLISSFTNVALRQWLQSLGIETFVGSSKRVFPLKGIKPIEVLTAIINSINRKNVTIKTRCSWEGWDSDNLVFTNTATAGISKKLKLKIKPDIIVFALGGASWKITGSDGMWKELFESKGISVLPFQPSNCAFEVKWNESFIKQVEGKSLKNIALKCGALEKKGELVITKRGLEGGAIYALSGEIREQLNSKNSAEIYLDLKPHYTIEKIKTKLYNRGNQSLTKHLESELNLSSVQLTLLKALLQKDEFTNSAILAEKIKNLPIKITATAPLDEAISTAGGVSLDEIDKSFQLKKHSDNYVIGEMLNWDAPTGGYLLQGCFSMGYFLAKTLNEKY